MPVFKSAKGRNIDWDALRLKSSPDTEIEFVEQQVIEPVQTLVNGFVPASDPVPTEVSVEPESKSKKTKVEPMSDVTSQS